MADGHRFRPQSAGTLYYPQHSHLQQARYIPRNERQQSSTHSNFAIDTPSPKDSPDAVSSSASLYSMFGQGHQGGQHGRVNGGPGGGRMPMMYNYQHQASHQQQSLNQHHQSMQQDHSSANTNGNVLSQHASFPSGAMSTATPSFQPSGTQNGQSTTTRGGQAQQINEHWAEQLKLHKETERAHAMMIDQHAPNHYARTKGHENRSLSTEITGNVLAAISGTQDSEDEDRGRPSPPSGSTKRQDWHNMDMSGQGLKVLTPPVFAYTFLNELYVASNQIRVLPAAIGQLRHLNFLDASNNQLTELPAELGMCVYLKNLLLFDNKLRTLPFELGSLYQLEMLGIEGNDQLDQGMRQEIMERGTKSLVHYLREQAPIPLPPKSRTMVDLQSGIIPTQAQESIKVFSYNTLCDKYATPQQYGYTPSGALAWEYRKLKILEDIQGYDADIVCLQECDNDSFNEFYRMELAVNDYKGVFWPKSRARTMSEKDAKMVDGCATFFKKSKYILLDKQLVDFANIAINRPDMKNQHDIFNRVMPRDNIATLVFFENRETGGRFIVVNTHISWDTVYPDVKIVQTAILLDSIMKYAMKCLQEPPCKDKKIYAFTDESDGKSESAVIASDPAPSREYTSITQIPLIICGDFNSTASSAVYQLLAEGSIPGNHPEFRNHQYGNLTRDGVSHEFPLKSAYAILDGTADGMLFTNYVPHFSGILDYIWYSTNTLEVTQLLGPPDPEYLQRVPGFPHYHFPSDHLPLVSEFVIKGGSVKKDQASHPRPNFGPQSHRRN